MNSDNKSGFERYKRYYQNIGSSVSQPKTQAYTTAIFSFLAVSLFGWYAIRPTVETILFLQREIADNTVVNRQMEDKISKLIDVQTTIQQNQNNLPLLSEALPQDPAAVVVASALKNLAGNAGASVSAINLSNVPLVSGAATPSAQTAKSPLAILPNPKIMDIPITLNVSGTFSSLQNFLNSIVNLRRIITINAIDIAPNSQGGSGIGEPELRLVVRLTAHYLQ